MTNRTIKLSFWGSIIFVLVMVLGFGLIWYFSQNAKGATATTGNVDVVQTEAKAEKILAGRDNLSNMPVVAPTSDSVGKTNPFQ